MKTIEQQILINAEPSKVWSILTDFSAVATWNPFIRSITGSATQGDRLSVSIAVPGKSEMTFKPTVLIAEPGRELRWRGTVMGKWMFAGEHYFLLAPAANGAIQLTQGEHFSGLLAPLIMTPQILAATETGFVAMNRALRRRCE